MPQDDAGLDQVRTIYDHDLAGRGHLLGRRGPRRQDFTALPGPEGHPNPGQQRCHVDIAGGVEDRVVGDEDRTVEAARLVGIQGLDRLGDAGLGTAIAVTVVECAGQVPTGQCPGVVLGLFELRQRLGARPVRLPAIHSRLENHRRQDLEQRIQVARQSGDPDRHRVPASANRKRCSELIDGAGELESIPVAGASAHQLGGKDGEASLVEGDDALASTHGHADRHPRQTVIFEYQQLETVVELGPVKHPLLDDGPVLGGRRLLLPGRRGASQREQHRHGRGDDEPTPHRPAPFCSAKPGGAAITWTTLRLSFWR